MHQSFVSETASGDMQTDILEDKGFSTKTLVGVTVIDSWVNVFRINPEFRIFRLTFHRREESFCT